MSIWDTPIGELHGTWFALGALTTVLIILVVDLVKILRGDK